MTSKENSQPDDFQTEIAKILNLNQEQITALAARYLACRQNSSWEAARRTALEAVSVHVVYQATYEYWHELERSIPSSSELRDAKEVATAAFFGLKAKELNSITDEEFNILYAPWREAAVSHPSS